MFGIFSAWFAFFKLYCLCVEISYFNTLAATFVAQFFFFFQLLIPLLYNTHILVCMYVRHCYITVISKTVALFSTCFGFS